MEYHIPALLSESIEGLDIRPGGIYVDVTFGGGGHSSEILRRLTTGRLVAFDQDEDAAANIPGSGNFTFLCQNFRYLRNNLEFNGIESIDGLIADLGVSFHQFDEPSRGFTFRHDAPLDMRMNREGSLTAAHILNTADMDRLTEIFSGYGELPGSRRIASEIINARSSAQINTVNDLLRALGRLIPARQEHKFLARLFQALRIAVNDELEALREMLQQALYMLKPGGRLVVLTYHSLEDRLVKNFMRSGNFEGEEQKDFYGNVITPFRLITKKGIVPAEAELESNNRARSARLRVAEKKQEND
ncbi:MAG: 16S rRNA (cytosine(1402)-N(4))-methyltransferase RsmH [Bacteroidales bacterium]|jgi:16S rRNA (cytosine1402-N4)-methyltransferase|nr:16S rRNA (cytosine(1402)-N(4))-methyltransferase RsmH [Bacteroidales bacterium]